jgi:hypothetical protein
LRPGGVFIFDYWHGPGVLNDPPVTRTKRAESPKLNVVRTAVPRHLFERHQVELSLFLEITEKDTNISQHVQETYLLRYWFPDELERHLQDSGFKGIRHYTWLTQSAPGPEAWEACTVAVKPQRAYDFVP